jgi:molybdopterin synthase catalytic subunit
VVLFTGNARNHAEGRTNVTGLAYEAYEEQVIPRFEEMVDEARRRWDPVGRLVILHRTGPVKIGDAAVLVAVSAPHREEAFAAGRWCIDTLKETVPIWKRETWEGGEHWAVDAQHIVDVTGADGRRIGDAEALLAVVPTDQQAGLESSGDGT